MFVVSNVYVSNGPLIHLFHFYDSLVLLLLKTHCDLPFLLLHNRHKRVLIAGCLPAERAMREHGRELRLPEADQLPTGLPGQQ